jgi:hypothetical protein
MTVAECRKRMTWREFLTWLAYLDQEMDRPSREDHYLMQLAALVDVLPARVWGKRAKIRPDDFRIKFEDASVPKTKEEATKASQSKWFAITGYKQDGC